ncbi:hypothetical protein PPSIR1_33636 [Plesiocystis pacifica SIR-1]|uniref:Outer membrane protein beta-barrel domain-containing protein n=1 Tax=Plesiocystis pacifica SIR-1 TaxID=391625 RepID=A6GE71_9BACT|nr:hypothetical protein [Plesiocystis pacifica]EDM75862.1 hypothetical protein PPSIR1_33636 [Plesiocystis pacifica SIR-1]
MTRHFGSSPLARPLLALAPLALGGALSLGLMVAAPGEAQAAVRGGPNGIEFEGAQDRRGVYLGPGVYFGSSFMKDTIVPDVGLSFSFGGGVSKRFLLGVNLHGAKYLGRQEGASSWVFGGDFEAQAFAWRGLYIRTGLGGQGLPAGDPNNTLTVGVGGNVGVGYEFWLNATAAASVGITYDGRYVTGAEELVPDRARHSGMVGMRFTFY